MTEQFPHEEAARLYLEKYYWDGKPKCPRCKSDTRQSERKGSRAGYFICHNCGLEYTVRTGTVFERSHIPLYKWILAMDYMTKARKGISSYQLAHEIDITQKSAHHMLHRLRESCKNDGSILLKNKVESDEVFTGGKEKNRHAFKKLNLGRGPVGKTPILVMKERGGPVIATVLKDIKPKTVQDELNKNIHKDATLYTDEHPSYQGNPFNHKVVNHSKKQYVDDKGEVHVNSAESYNALIKRAHYGIHHHYSPKHTQRYVDETSFRQNEGNRKYSTMERIHSLLNRAKGKRLTYKQMKDSQPPQLYENINHRKKKRRNNIMDKPIRKPLIHKSFKGSQIEQLNENEGYKMNTRLALQLGSLMFLSEALESKNPNGKPILEFNNPVIKTVEASNIKVNS
jgi:transposase-like protein